MAKRTIKNVTLMLKNKTAAAWADTNPILAKGEMGLESDTGKFKFGDGATDWQDLPYGSSIGAVIRTTAPTAYDVDYEVGTFWINTEDETQIYVLINVGTYATWLPILTANGVPELADEANKLAKAFKLTLNGDIVEVYKSIDGSEDVSLNVVLKDQTLSEGEYTKVTVNSKGIVTATANLTESDIPMLHLDKLEDAGTAAQKNIGTEPGEIPVIGADGKIDSDLIPSVSITDVFVVSSEAEMLALEAEQGDVAIRTDVSNTFILQGSDPTVLSNWVELLHPGCDVVSVNGKTGTVVLTTDDIAEGAENLYFTKARADENFDANIKDTTPTDLKDGDEILLESDEYVIDCGSDAE